MCVSVSVNDLDLRLRLKELLNISNVSLPTGILRFREAVVCKQPTCRDLSGFSCEVTSAESNPPVEQD